MSQLPFAVAATLLLACEPATQVPPSPRPKDAATLRKRALVDLPGKIRRLDAGAVRPFLVDSDDLILDDLVLMAADRAHEIKTGNKTLTTLPFKLRVVDATTLATSDFWPVIEPVRDVLEFDPTTKAYQNEVRVGLLDKNGFGGSTRLPQALTLQLVTSQGRAVPASVSIDHVGVPFSSVALTVTDDVPDVRLRVLWGTEPDDSVERRFPLSKPQIRLEANPSRIAGFGLAVADITIRATGAGARGAKSAVVHHDRGDLEGSQQVALDAEGIGIAHLRSAGVGTAKVTVTVSTFEPAQVDVYFHWPIAFLVSAITGGLVGGFARHVRGRRIKRNVRRELIRSTLIGLVVVVASAVGINLVGFQLPTGVGEAFVFVVAALGAMKGIKMPDAKAPSPNPAG